MSTTVAVPQLLEELEKIQFQLKRRRLLNSFKDFVQEAWELVEPETKLFWNWHLDEICNVLEDVEKGKLTRVIINVPPGTMKSYLVSVFFRAWRWARKPSLRFFTASYGAHLSLRDNTRLYDIVTSKWYKELFPEVQLDGEATAYLQTTASGWSIASSIGGIGIGEHPDMVVVDDPLSDKHARSDTERKAVTTWWKRTMSTRGVARSVAVLVIMQRLHVADLSGFLLAQGGWEHVCFPMKYVASKPNQPDWRPDPRDHRTVPGELLWPALFTKAAVKQMELDLDPFGASGQLQQDPVPEGGGLFKRIWFKIVDVAPEGGLTCRGWDTASTEDAGDYTVGTKMRRVGFNFYVMHVERGQWGPADVDKTMYQTALLDGRGIRIREEKEPGSSGKTVVLNRARLLAGFDYDWVPVDSDKITRARPFRAQAEAGNVYLVRGPWNEAYLYELENFPVGESDDQIDSSSCAFNDLTTGPQPIQEVNIAWG